MLARLGSVSEVIGEQIHTEISDLATVLKCLKLSCTY